MAQKCRPISSSLFIRGSGPIRATMPRLHAHSGQGWRVVQASSEVMMPSVDGNGRCQSHCVSSFRPGSTRLANVPYWGVASTNPSGSLIRKVARFSSGSMLQTRGNHRMCAGGGRARVTIVLRSGIWHRHHCRAVGANQLWPAGFLRLERLAFSGLGARGSLPCSMSLASRAFNSSTARSTVSVAGSVPLGTDAFTTPSVT